MQKKYITFLVGVVILTFLISYALLIGYTAPEPVVVPKQEPQKEEVTMHSSGNIFVTLPKKNELVPSTFTVAGSARGFWYFEASFPVSVLGGDGTVLWRGIATADGEWMTENFVPFTFEVTLPKNSTSTSGILRLHKDDHSGENPDMLDVPIRFSDI